MASNQPSPPAAQPPPDLPDMPEVSDTLSQYLRRFALWCRNGFADKLSSTSALPGVVLQAADAPAGTAPNVFQLGVNQAGKATLASIPLGKGVMGPAIPIASVGTATNDSAPAGSIGEVISSNVASPGVTLSTGVVTNVTSISLTAGDWDVCGEVWVAVGSSVAAQIQAGITSVSATMAASGVGTARSIMNVTFAASQTSVIPVRPARVSLSATTTYYLLTNVSFPSGVTTAYGNIWARRAR